MTTEPKKKEYKVDGLEKGFYHVELEKKAFDPNTGKKISKHMIQKYTKRDFENFKKNTLGYSYEILHTPK